MPSDIALVEDVASVVREVAKLNGNLEIDKDLYTELGVESVNAIGILLALEEKFGIAIDDSEFIQARTITKLADLVTSVRG
jgi:acyl carrier protein